MGNSTLAPDSWPGLTLFLAIWSGVRSSRWWWQWSGVREGRHTRGGHPWVPYTRWGRGRWYSPPDKDTAGEPVSRLVSLLQNTKQSKLNIVSSLFVVVKCSQVYWISQYNQKFTSPSTSYMTCTCIYRCICTNEKATFLTRELPKNRWTHNWLPLKHWPPCDIWHMIPQFRLLWYIIGIFLYLKTWYFKIAIKFWFSWLKKKIISIHTIHKHFLRCWVNKGLSRFFYGQRSLIFNIDLVTSNSIEVITLLKAQSNGS